MDILFMLVKSNSRQLTKTEKIEAKKVFGNSIPYDQIRIDEKSWIAQKGAQFAGYPNLGMGLVLFRSINFNRVVNCSERSSDMAWLIHEITHIQQMQSIGTMYIFESLIAQHYLGYQLPNLNVLSEINLNQLNIEQQAEVSKHIYQNNITQNIGSKLIKQIRTGKFN